MSQNTIFGWLNDLNEFGLRFCCLVKPNLVALHFISFLVLFVIFCFLVCFGVFSICLFDFGL